MPIVAKRPNTSFTPAPEGPQQAVCVDVVDLGLVEQNFGSDEGDATLKPMVRIVWHSAEIDPATGKPYTISNRYTLSLHEKANLRKHLESWRGRVFTEAELDGFDLETVIGANAYIQIVHKVSGKGQTFANIASIMSLPKGMTGLPVTAGYTRQCERDDWEPPNQNAPMPNDHTHETRNDDDDIPF